MRPEVKAFHDALLAASSEALKEITDENGMVSREDFDALREALRRFFDKHIAAIEAQAAVKYADDPATLADIRTHLCGMREKVLLALAWRPPSDKPN